MSNDNLRVGIIGVGSHATHTAMPQLRATGRAEVSAICRRNPEKLAMIQKAFGVPEAYTDWEEMLDQADLDAVVVDTPHYLHAEHTLGALERGLHVLVGKPMALTGQDARDMVETAQRVGRVLMVYRVPLGGLWHTVKNVIEEGAIGTLRQINIAEMTYRRWFWGVDPIPEEDRALARRMLEMMGLPPEAFHYEDDWAWRADPDKMGGGAFVDNGNAPVFRALWLADSPPLEVVAFTESAGMPVEAYLNAQARLANGVLFSLTFADAGPKPMLQGAYRPANTIIGDEGVLFDDREGFWLNRGSTQEELVVDLPDTTDEAAFVTTILDGIPNPSSARVGAWGAEFMEAVYTSAAEGRIVRIERHDRS